MNKIDIRILSNQVVEQSDCLTSGSVSCRKRSHLRRSEKTATGCIPVPSITDNGIITYFREITLGVAILLIEV